MINNCSYYEADFNILGSISIFLQSHISFAIPEPHGLVLTYVYTGASRGQVGKDATIYHPRVEVPLGLCRDCYLCPSGCQTEQLKVIVWRMDGWMKNRKQVWFDFAVACTWSKSIFFIVRVIDGRWWYYSRSRLFSERLMFIAHRQDLCVHNRVRWGKSLSIVG